MGNAINSLENKIIDANNADLLHTLYRRWRWHALAKTWASLDTNRTNAWLDNNSVISVWQETSDCLNLILACFWRHFVSHYRGNKQLVKQRKGFKNEVGVNGPESKRPFSVNANESQYSHIGESENIYEYGKISSIVNLD